LLQKKFIFAITHTPWFHRTDTQVIRYKNIHKLTRAINIGNSDGLDDKEDMKPAEGLLKMQLSAGIICMSLIYAEPS